MIIEIRGGNIMNNSTGCFTVTDWNKVKGAIRLQVTSNTEDTKHVLCKKYADLYVIPYFQLPSEGNKRTVKITTKTCEYFDISEDTIFKTALENMLSETKLLTDADILNELLTNTPCLTNYMKDGLPDKFVFLTLTNESHENAAAAIFCSEVQIRLSELFPEGYYILPSSIHEFLIYPHIGCTVKNLLDVVREVNSTAVSPKDYLSGNVYCFDKDGNFCIACLH